LLSVLALPITVLCLRRHGEAALVSANAELQALTSTTR
jgi:hypothetical protein